jgi:enediyne polyketide synthase
VYFPGIELIVETMLSQGRDPYLGDHAPDGHAVLPGVMGMEAMAQIAFALMPLGDHTVVSDVAFTRAVQVPADSELRIRIAGLRTRQSVEVTLSAEDDDFSVPCMRATFSTGMIEPAGIDLPQSGDDFPVSPLYGPLFFGGDRFQQLEHLTMATSRHVSAQLRPKPGTRWFGAYEPERVVLWDPGAADAMLHALQVAVPHKRVLPVSAESFELDRSAGASVHVRAVEKKAIAGTYIFDIIATDAQGRVACRCSNVAFRAVGQIDITPVLAAAPLLARPYLERVAREALGDDSIEVAFIHDRNSSRDIRRIAALRAFDLNDLVERRGDGRPTRNDGNGSISLAHGDAITLAVTAKDPIGCDIEAISAGDLDELRRHVVFEVCRKLGRRPAGALRAPVSGAVAAIDDVDLVAVDLPTPSGSHTVAFGRVRRPVATPLQPSPLPISEAVP